MAAARSRTGSAPDDGWRFDGFLDFIDNYIEACALLSTTEDFRRVAEEFCADLAANGVRYAEAVFSPGNHAARLDDWYGPIEAVLDGLEAGRRDHGVQVARVPRHRARQRAGGRGAHARGRAEVRGARRRRAERGRQRAGAGGRVRADVPTREGRRAAERPPRRGVGGPQNVWETLAQYAPDRIGHGVRAIEDPRLVEELASRGIPLEVSPVSNVATGVYPSLAEHPFLRLRDAGVIVTLNSDDPSMFGTWIGGVYEAARTSWALSDDELAALARAGVEASFADDATKRSVLGRDRRLVRPARPTATRSPTASAPSPARS